MNHKAQWRRLIASLLAAGMVLAAPFTATASEEIPVSSDIRYSAEISPPEEASESPIEEGNTDFPTGGLWMAPALDEAESAPTTEVFEENGEESAPQETEENTDNLVATQAASREYSYLGVKTEAKVYEDFENDLWLQYQQREMEVGDTAIMYPWRVPQIISNAISNDVQRPEFRFEIISGDSIELDSETTSTSITATAVKPGTTVVQVTYGELSYDSKDYGGISPINTCYVVYTVGETGTVEPEISENLQNWRLYDTIYYSEGETVPFTFTAEASEAVSLEVTLNGLPIEGKSGVYTAELENRSNIIGVVATDSDDNTKSVYRIVDARFMEVNIANKTRPGETLLSGDTATVSFRGIVMPVYKLATIYNPQMGKNATRVVYENKSLGKFEGKCSQWDLATKNSFDVSFTEAGSYAFASDGIYCAWWGSNLGTETTMNGSGQPNLNAPTLEDWFSTLPSFTITVGESIPVTEVKLNQTSLELKLNAEAQLTAQVLPENATNKAVTWTSSNSKIVSVSSYGKVTAISAGTATITAEAEGVKRECVVTVLAVPLKEAEKAIAAIPDADTLTLRDKTLVENARRLYDNLSAEDKDKLDDSPLTAAEIKLEELMETPFLFSLNGRVLSMENTGKETGYRGHYYKVTVPAGIETVQIERFKEINLMKQGYTEIIPSGLSTADVPVSEYVGEGSYFILNYDTFTYDYIYFEQESIPEGKTLISFTLLGDIPHKEDENNCHTLAGGGLQEWISEPEYLVNEGATVAQVLEELLKANDMTCVNKGNYISSITKDGVELAEFTNGSLSGWMYTLNGKYSDLGVDEQTLQTGDVVVVHYTDDFTKERADLDPDQPNPPTDPDQPKPEEPDEPKKDKDVSAILDRTLAWIYKHTPAPAIGTLGGEWSVMALVGGEYASSSWLEGYYNRVVAELQENQGILEGDRKFTEYSRVILGLSAAGYNPTNIGGYNLVEKLADFDQVVKQGINGPIWALIALDSKDYNTSDANIRQKYVDEILSKEISGGGFALSGSNPDPDMTAMAIQALTPYRSNSGVNAVIQRAVSRLSTMQINDGGLGSWGSNANCEAICQTIIALCGLDINPHTDQRFIKNGNSLVDALLTFEVSGGGFMHVHPGDNAGGGAEGGVADGMPTDQAAMALLAYQRLTKGAPPIYDNSGTTSRDPIRKEEEKAKDETPVAEGPVEKEYSSKDNKGTWKKYQSGAWTLTDSQGNLLTGWQKVDGNWYYFQETGEMRTGRQEIDGKTYFLKDWGGMRTGWFILDGVWYCCASSGELLENPAPLPMVASSYVSKDNTGRWQRHTDGRWSFTTDKGFASSWQKVDNNWYFFDTAHAMITGWQMVNDSWYYLNNSGAMATGWQMVNGSWYYLNSSGAMATGWQMVNGSWYYLNSNGAMATGQIQVDGVFYQLSASGQLIAQ